MFLYDLRLDSSLLVFYGLLWHWTGQIITLVDLILEANVNFLIEVINTVWVQNDIWKIELFSRFWLFVLSFASYGVEIDVCDFDFCDAPFFIEVVHRSLKGFDCIVYFLFCLRKLFQQSFRILSKTNIKPSRQNYQKAHTTYHNVLDHLFKSFLFLP